MVSRPFSGAGQAAWAINLQLSHGRHGAMARIEWHSVGDQTVTVLSLSGFIERIGLRRLERVLDQLAEHGVRRLLLDGSQLRYIDYGLLTLLVRSLARFDAPFGRWMVCGLPTHLDDLFRLAGLGTHVLSHPVPEAASALALEAACETAS